jgi:hypothetical protein
LRAVQKNPGGRTSKETILSKSLASVLGARRWLLVVALATTCACSSDKDGGGVGGSGAGGTTPGPGGTGGAASGGAGAGGTGGSASGGAGAGSGGAGAGGAGAGSGGAGPGSGGAGAGGASGSGGAPATGGAGGASGMGGVAGGTGGAGAGGTGGAGLGCLDLLMCLAPCAPNDDGCVSACVQRGSQQGTQQLLNLASCSERWMCGSDDTCLARNCAAELRDCSGGGGGMATRERLIGRWWNSPTGDLYAWYTFTEQGFFSYSSPLGRMETGPFTVQGDQLTLTPDSGPVRRYTFGIECVGGDALLNLTDATGLKVGYWRHVDSPGGKSGGFCQ